jgi:hypothetical protein
LKWLAKYGWHFNFTLKAKFKVWYFTTLLILYFLSDVHSVALIIIRLCHPYILSHELDVQWMFLIRTPWIWRESRYSDLILFWNIFVDISFNRDCFYLKMNFSFIEMFDWSLLSILFGWYLIQIDILFWPWFLNTNNEITLIFSKINPWSDIDISKFVSISKRWESDKRRINIIFSIDQYERILIIK